MRTARTVTTRFSISTLCRARCSHPNSHGSMLSMRSNHKSFNIIPSMVKFRHVHNSTTTDKKSLSEPAAAQQFDKKSTARSTNNKSSLRRVASPTHNEEKKYRLYTKNVTAYCTAEKYSLHQANSLLKSGGYVPDPLSTGLGSEVIHLRLPLPAHRHIVSEQSAFGDVFIFPSGNIVSWAIPESTITSIAALIRPSAESPHKETETENLEFIEDDGKSSSYIHGDVITIGTATSEDMGGFPSVELGPEDDSKQNTTTVLAKIAFSSGLARSTKLAVLESLLNTYLESTASIPVLLSRGSRLPFTRSFILKKTGELLHFRAQLNLYSELTDSLPDIFWDSRSELGLEGYYESVGRELDVRVRIRQLNEKLDYANEMAGVLREQLSERHGLVLEWMIIILIAVEVGFEIMRLYKERQTELKEKSHIIPPAKPSPPDLDTDAADFERITQLQSRIRARHQRPQHQQQHHTQLYSTRTRRQQEQEDTLNHASRDDVYARMEKMRIARQRQRDDEASRPSAAAADENFEYMHQRPSIMDKVNEYDEWLLSCLPYDIRTWGRWR